MVNETKIFNNMLAGIREVFSVLDFQAKVMISSLLKSEIPGLPVRS